jgi:hypothetical protein
VVVLAQLQLWIGRRRRPTPGSHQYVLYSLAACCVTAFALSSLVSKDNKFDMVKDMEKFSN